MLSKIPKSVKFAKCVRTDDDAVTVPNLAYDLSKLDQMRRNGEPISITNVANNYYDGSETCTFDVPLDMQRGVDINDMWNEHQQHKSVMSKLKISKVDVATKM